MESIRPWKLELTAFSPWAWRIWEVRTVANEILLLSAPLICFLLLLPPYPRRRNAVFSSSSAKRVSSSWFCSLFFLFLLFFFHLRRHLLLLLPPPPPLASLRFNQPMRARGEKGEGGARYSSFSFSVRPFPTPTTFHEVPATTWGWRYVV